MPDPYRVGIVGYGVAGATSAYLLAKAGHEVTIFERSPKVGPVGAGVLLQPSGQLVLSRLGLLDEVIARAEPIEELHALTDRGRTLIRLPYAEVEPGMRAYGVHRGDLFEALHRAVGRGSTVERLGCEITTYRETPNAVFVIDSNGQEFGPFDFVLAADGSRSNLRIASGLSRWSHEYAHGAMWAIGRSSAVSGKLHQVVRGTKSLLGLLPMGDGRCSLFWSLRRDAKDAVREAGFDTWRREVVTLCPLAEELLSGLRGWDDVAYTRYQHVWMKRWHTNRVLFLGDAAHAMSPHLGQGINLALIDAFSFATELAGADTFEQAIGRHTSGRRAHIRFYGSLTLALTPFFQSNGWVKGVGRDVALPILTHLPIIRGQMILAMSGLKRGFFRGRMRLP